MKSLLKKLSPLLNEFIPEDIALKGIEKLSPKIGQFLKTGLASGLPLAGGLAFLKSAMSGKGNKEISSSLRPDERASERQIQSSKKQSNILKGAAKLGLGAAGGFGVSKIASNIASSLIPGEEEPQESIQPPSQEDVQRQEALGQFKQRQQKKFGLKEGLQEDFDKYYGKQEQQNLLQAYSPELHQFIEEQLQNGRKLEEAAAVAYGQEPFKKIISKLEQDFRSPFARILGSIYGGMKDNKGQGGTGKGQEALLKAIQNLRNIRGQ